MSDADQTSPTTQPRGRAGLLRRIIRTFARADDAAADAVAEALRGREERGAAPLGGAQQRMILNAARFDQMRVSDVMRPRTDIVAIEASATLADAAVMFADSQHSRLPVYRETLDDPLGFVHVKDVMALLTPDEAGQPRSKPTDRPLARIKREILFVPSSMRLPSLLLKMQTSRIHLALVVDEYGGTDGLVTIEDIVEQIVGDIADEHDVDESDLIVSRSGVYEADGRADVAALEARLGVSLALPDEEAEFDTVGGLAVAILGRVPQRGEVVQHPAGFDLEVLDADPRRVKRLRVKPASVGQAEAQPE